MARNTPQLIVKTKKQEKQKKKRDIGNTSSREICSPFEQRTYTKGSIFTIVVVVVTVVVVCKFSPRLYSTLSISTLLLHGDIHFESYRPKLLLGGRICNLLIQG